MVDCYLQNYRERNRTMIYNGVNWYKLFLEGLIRLKAQSVPYSRFFRATESRIARFISHFYCG